MAADASIMTEGNFFVGPKEYARVAALADGQVDVLQFSGTVDPRTIRPGNTVPSTQVADVRVLSRGRGAQADAQTFGWLSRFFLTLLPF